MIGSPNLSLSTSPSLASPSNSTKSTSNSSTSSISNTTASSSSSSTSSNSPSPALLSPNISNTNKGPTSAATVRLESPLVSSKAGTNTTTTINNNNNYINLHNTTTTTNTTNNTSNSNNNININTTSNRLNNHNNRTSHNLTDATTHIKSQPSNVALPPLDHNNIQTRINIDNPSRSESKKNSMASSSLLSTAAPMTHEAVTSNPEAGSSSSPSTHSSATTKTATSSKTNSNNSNTNSASTKLNSYSSSTQNKTNNNYTKSSDNNKVDGISSLQSTYAALSNKLIGGPVTDSSSKNPSGSCNSVTPNVNTQPTVPPLIIPVPQKEQSVNNVNLSTTSNNTTSKTANKSKTPAKSTRKKSTENNSAAIKKPEPKSKPTRARKAAVTTSNTNETTANTTPKPETNKRSKSKAAGKTTEQPSSNLTPATLTAMTDSELTNKTQAPLSSSPAKRKSRFASNESSSTSSPTKRQRKKKTDTVPQQNEASVPNSKIPINMTPALQTTSTTSNVPIGPCGPLTINTPSANSRMVQGLNSIDSQNAGSKYFSPMISPYANFDPSTAPSLTRSSLSRLFTASSAINNQISPLDEPGKAFEELRENVWSQLSKCVLEQAQQFDIPSHIGLLYTLRSENEKLESRLRDMSAKRDQLIAMNARLDMPGPMLTKNLNSTSPNFSSLVTGLTNSPQHLVNSSPVTAINKQPLVSVGSFNHVPPGSLGPPSYLDRSSPLVGQSHSGLNNIKSSSISTPSPPIGAMMAHSNSNRAGLITVNSSYMPNVFSPMNTLTQLGPNPQGSSYYSRQQS